MWAAVFLLLLSIFSDGAHSVNPPAVNFTLTLVSAGNFTTLTNLLQSTGLEATLMARESDSGITLFAPTDDAFTALPAGDLATLTQQQITLMLEYHVLPSYFTLTTLEAISSPVQTLAAQNGANFSLNISTSSDTVTLNTGVEVLTTLVDQSPLVAVYVITAVLSPAGMLTPALTPGVAPAPTPALTPGATPALGPAHSPLPSFLGPLPAPVPASQFFRPLSPFGMNNSGHAPSTVPESSSRSSQIWSIYFVAAMVVFTICFMQ